MKIFKLTFWVILILFAIVLLFRGSIYRLTVEYKSIGQRKAYAVSDSNLIVYLNAYSHKNDSVGIEEVIGLALEATSKQLNFTMSKNSNNPNRIINTHTANCVGYSSFYATTCNYLLNKYSLSDTWIVKHYIGQLYVFGDNIHKYIDSPFFKDHDFVVIKNITTGEEYAVDPTVRDYLLINYVTFIK